MLKTNILKNNIDKIDNWRGILSLIVLFSHSIQLLCPNRMIQDWMIIIGPVAHIAVLLFFFLSGFVIFYSIENRFKTEKKIILIFYNYLHARFIRIYPPLFGLIVILILLKSIIKLNYSILPEEFMFSIEDLFSYSLMLKVSLGKINAPLWTLILEWWLYIIGFIVYCMLIVKKSQKIICALLIITMITFITIKINDHFIVYFIIWIIGAMFYYVKIFEFRKLLFIFSTFCFTYTFIYKNILFNGLDISKQPYLQILTIFSLIGILFIFKRNKILALISSFSYSIYIIHYPFFIFIKLIFLKSGINKWSELIFIDTLIILISFVFSKFFEDKKKMLKITNHIKLKLFNK